MRQFARLAGSLSAAISIGLLCSAARPADAQLPILPKIRLKAGVFAASDAQMQSAIGDAWVKVGADVSLPIGLPMLGGGTRVGIDYLFNGKSNIVPVTLTSVIQPSLGLTVPVYAGAGIGLWTGHIQGTGTSSRVGFRLLAGMEMGAKNFLEVQYDRVDRLGGVRADGFSVLFGMKF